MDNFVRPLNDATIFEHQLDYWTPQNTDAKYPRKILSSTGFNRVRIYFTANNLFTISDFVPGMDPEASSAWAYPFARTYSFGLNVQF